MSDSLDAYLVLSGLLFAIGIVRLPGPAQRDQHADVDRADAQRGQPRDRRVRRVRRRRSQRQGSVIALIVMAVAAAEATVGLAIVIAIYRNKKTPLVDEYDAMRAVTACDVARSPLIVVLPLAGFLFTALIGRRLGQAGPLDPGPRDLRRLAHRDGASSFSVLTGAAPLLPVEHGRTATSCLVHVDPGRQLRRSTSASSSTTLTACLLIVVTTIGLLVHVYSIGYMSHDPGYWRFFAYLNLFMFSMLLLVLADNFLVVFVAWELVGLSQLPADRLLVPQALGGARGEEGVHRQPRRRRRLHPRDHADLRQPRHARTSARSLDADRRRSTATTITGSSPC